MSSYSTDDSVLPTTPIFDETVSATSVYVDAEPTGTPSASDHASQAADTAKDAASKAKETDHATCELNCAQAARTAGPAKPLAPAAKKGP